MSPTRERIVNALEDAAGGLESPLKDLGGWHSSGHDHVRARIDRVVRESKKDNPDLWNEVGSDGYTNKQTAEILERIKTSVTNSGARSRNLQRAGITPDVIGEASRSLLDQK